MPSESSTDKIEGNDSQTEVAEIVSKKDDEVIETNKAQEDVPATKDVIETNKAQEDVPSDNAEQPVDSKVLFDIIFYEFIQY